MSSVPSNLVEIGASFEQRYQPVLDFSGWRVAMLRHCDHVEPELFWRIERHRETNEVFILTAGSADLIIFDGGDTPTASYVFPMELNVAYNIGQSVWHHVVMTPDAHVILFKRTNTALENSDYAELSPETIEQIKAQFSI